MVVKKSGSFRDTIRDIESLSVNGSQEVWNIQ
jgi:hypothetical protein